MRGLQSARISVLYSCAVPWSCFLSAVIGEMLPILFPSGVHETLSRFALCAVLGAGFTRKAPPPTDVRPREDL
jgi:hypothetical protein